MICPECGSYQPDRAKYCGICGAGLSQDGLVESFLKDDTDQEIALPRHRSPWFYLVMTLIAILALAALAGAGYLVYRIAWGEHRAENGGGEVEDRTQHYTDPDLGFAISYPDNWSVEEAIPAENEVAALAFRLSTQKFVELRVYQLDPLVSIGGIDAIREYLAEDAASRMQSLGGKPGGAGASPTPDAQLGYGEEPPSATAPGSAAGGDAGGTSSGEMFISTRVSGFPAFYTEFSTNIMGEETEILLFYIVAGDYIFTFQARSPAGEYEGVRPQFFSITGSFKWERMLEDQAPESAPGASVSGIPMITCS